MADYPEIFVLRHGQTEWNCAGRHQGRKDSPLTDLGRAQARDQAVILAREVAGRDDIDAFCSPQGRARDTARLAVAPLGHVPGLDARLCEISFGQWEGLTFDEISQGWPERVVDANHDVFGWHFASPGGESFDAVYSRAKDFLDSLTAPTIIVTHGITSRFLRGIWLGADQGGMAALAGGQGCVYHLRGGKQRRLAR
jgi:broad specificity phosphatase PhoE